MFLYLRLLLLLYAWILQCFHYFPGYFLCHAPEPVFQIIKTPSDKIPLVLWCLSLIRGQPLFISAKLLNIFRPGLLCHCIRYCLTRFFIGILSYLFHKILHIQNSHGNLIQNCLLLCNSLFLIFNYKVLLFKIACTTINRLTLHLHSVSLCYLQKQFSAFCIKVHFPVIVFPFLFCWVRQFKAKLFQCLILLGT